MKRNKGGIMQTREQEIDEFIHHVKTTGGIAREDADLEVAELLAQKINHSAFFNLFNAFELERIRHFIKSKREGGEHGGN